MIADLKPYLEYKESGIPWLGKVPLLWQTKRLKNWVAINERVVSENTDKAFAFDYLDIGAVGTGSLTRKLLRHTFGVAPSRARRIVTQGDTVVSTVRTYLKAVYTVSALEGPLIASTGFAVLSPRNDTEPRFVGLLAQSHEFASQVMSESRGIAYPAISETAFSNIAIAVPPPPDQRAIVRFLDHVNGRLEAMIRAKRKVIMLLNEQKDSTIHHAVTRGFAPSVLLKPSGIPWLPVIPANWQVLRSKYIYREVDNRQATGKETHLSMSQKFGLIPSSQIEEKRLVSESYAGAKVCEKSDLVLNRLKAHLGVFALAPERGLVSPDYTVLRPVRELEERYFEAVYRTPACRVELRQRAKGIVQGFWRLYTDDFYDIRMPVPPVDEQKSIMAQLGGDLSGVNTAINRVRREIDLLREYRTRLVADVVTGKLDVRDAAEGLPDEAPPDTAEDDTDLGDETETAEEEATV